MNETRTIDIDTDLDTAKGALQRFRNSRSANDLEHRLETLSPMHPVLWIRRISAVAAVTLLVSATVWTAVVASGVHLPAVMHNIVATPSGGLAPAVLLGLAVCAAAVYVCAKQIAAILGEQAPMLPAEAKQFQRLQSDVLRHSARQNVRAKLKSE